jgi:hypothetical protein
MKLPQQEYEKLLREIYSYASKQGIGFGTRGMRDWWDAFASVMDAREEKEHKSGWSYFYDKLGLNDNNIETALRKIAQGVESTKRNPVKKAKKMRRKLTTKQAKYLAKGRPQPAFAKRLRRGKPKKTITPKKVTRARRNPSFLSEKHFLIWGDAKGKIVYFTGTGFDTVKARGEVFKTKTAALHKLTWLQDRVPHGVGSIGVMPV